MDNLEYLNMKDSRIVEGGSAYYENYKTENNILGDYFFWKRPNLKQFICPKDIVAIGSLCFSSNIEKVTMFDKVESIGNFSFSMCKLNYVDIPMSVMVIGDYAFQYCQSLSAIIIPLNVTKIGVDAFKGCNNVTEVHIKAMPETLIAIGSDAFEGIYDKATLYIPKGTRDAYMLTELSRFTNVVEE